MEDQQFKSRRQFGDIEEEIDKLETMFWKFKNFAIFPNVPPDHRFIHDQFNPDENIFINKEWKTLEANLPDSIYVRAYKSRQDLMRAVIVGPKGTSYSHGLFFFDIRFPSNYPAQPPELFYHSYGLDVNSNLKRNGKVNLNLLKYWHQWCEHKEQRRNPKQSIIVQVIVSIRDLVFNRKPYLGGCYNKEVLKQMCKAMLFMLRDPPIDFKVFVEGYLRTNAHPILLNYKAQMGDSKATNQLFFKLVRAFEENGTYCRHHYNQQQYEQALKAEELLEEKSEGTISKIWSKLKILEL